MSEIRMFFRNSRSKREVEWDIATAEKMLGITKEEILNTLSIGETIKVPFGTLRLSTTEICPLCGDEFKDGLYAISRRDNETKICPSCGNKEAFQDMAYSKKVKIKLFDTHFAWVSEMLLNSFTTITGITRKPSWIKTCAEIDFGIELNEKEDLTLLDEAVRLALYEDKAEWLKEKMRNEIKKKMGHSMED